MRNGGASKVPTEDVSRRPPAGAILLRAAARAEPLTSAAGRTVTFCASDPSVGRDMHTIAPDAWQTANFLRNPVFLWAHRADDPPIGRVTNLYTVGARLMAAVEYAERDAYPFADTIYQLVKQGFLDAVSTGWIPLEWKAALDRARPGGLDFTRVELLELSQVPVPALPTALAAGRAAGVDTTSFVAWAERALDAPSAIDRKEELVMIRNAAGAVPAYAAPRHSSFGGAGVLRAGDDAGFASFGHFLQAVARAGSAPENRDRRLTRAPAAVASETDPTAGGFLVPTAYVESLIASMYDEAVIAPLCDRMETDRPATAVLPGIDETSRADGSRWGGATAYWSVEAPNVSPSKPKFRRVEFGAHKLYAVCFASGELIEDAPMLDAYMRRAFAAEMSFKLDTAIVSGQGAGQPQGVLNSQALITVAKDSGQSPATVSLSNVENMWAALPVPSRRRAVWLVQELVEKQISTADVTPATMAMYMPAGAAGNASPLLKGRPLVQIEQANPVGTPGDIILGDFSQYGIVDGGLKANLSMEADFLHDQGIFRFAWRVDGRTLWSSPVTSYSDSSQRSPFVALAARS